jgi:hypothetical protein
MRMNRITRLKCALVLGLFPASLVDAQTPLGTGFTYQGQLKSSGVPASGLHDFRFRLYDALIGGAQVGTTLCVDNVSVADGLLTVTLDFGAQFHGDERFLEIDVRADSGLDCGDPAGFVALAPRQPLTVGPSASFALNTDRLDGLDSTAFLQAVPTPLSLSGSQAGSHIIHGTNTSSAFGSIGVSGVSSASVGVTYGGLFQSVSTSGAGVFGYASANAGGTRGVTGRSDSTTGVGVLGWAVAPTGGTIGVYGTSDSTGGYAVYGDATAPSGVTYGGHFQSHSPSGFGGFFKNTDLGNDFDVELSGPNGAVNTPGFIYREYTPTTRSAAIPIAYGSVNSAGVILSGTGNFVVTHPATGEYEVTVSGETYSNADYTVTITPVSNSPRVSNVADGGSGFQVNMWSLSSATLVDNAFQFTIWKSDPN